MTQTTSLAIKYRPTTWKDVTEQDDIVVILQNQLETEEFRHAYLFCGPAGCGKTTCARIFAREINHGEGNPIEMDAASNNSVDDARNIIQQSRTQSLTSEYKIFIIDECHALSNSAWQAMLKIIEEPPEKSVFIFCTTNPERIPKTIISRVQRYDFQRISQQGIVDRLHYILDMEFENKSWQWHRDSLEYIAKLANGGMRDAITLLDKCLAFSTDLSIENVVSALGVTGYDIMFDMTRAIYDRDVKKVMSMIEELYATGKDLKQFVKTYTQFTVDIIKYFAGCDWSLLTIPATKEYKERISDLGNEYDCYDLLSTLINLSADIKYSSTPMYDMEAAIMIMMLEEK